jgi:hypothetical protein
MKKFILFVLIFYNAVVFSQNEEKSIVIKDADTELPIEAATVFVIKTKQTLLSNEEGKVSFILDGISNIQITNSIYSSLKVKSTTLKEKNNIIYLKKSMTGLEEIIVTKQHPQKILISIIENSIKKLTIHARLKDYTIEFFKLNGAKLHYSE